MVFNLKRERKIIPAPLNIESKIRDVTVLKSLDLGGFDDTQPMACGEPADEFCFLNVVLTSHSCYNMATVQTTYPYSVPNCIKNTKAAYGR